MRNAPPTEAAIATITPTVALVIVVAELVLLLVVVSEGEDAAAVLRTVE